MSFNRLDRARKDCYDVASRTAPEKRAPCEILTTSIAWRPFLQDMTYVQDLDIFSYTVAGDTDWWYVSIELIGTNPNNQMNIIYGVELTERRWIWRLPDLGASTLRHNVGHDPCRSSRITTTIRWALRGEIPMHRSTDGYETLFFNGGGRCGRQTWLCAC
jgi:hypothetical protein